MDHLLTSEPWISICALIVSILTYLVLTKTSEGTKVGIVAAFLMGGWTIVLFILFWIHPVTFISFIGTFGIAMIVNLKNDL